VYIFWHTKVTRLTAVFAIPVESECLVTWPTDVPMQWSFDVDGFCVDLRFMLEEGSKSKLKEEQDWTISICHLEVRVARSEDEPLPSPNTIPGGTQNMVPQSTFLRKLLPQYKAIARRVTNNTLNFFRFELNTPYVELIPDWHDALNNPKWYNDDGSRLSVGHLLRRERTPGLHGELGVKRFMPATTGNFANFVASAPEPSLAQVLLSDAQTAWFEGGLRRSVLELAICSELMVKRAFFSDASPAGAAFDYLEDKAKVNVRVLELLDQVALEAFSRSYKREHRKEYDAIDCLFRCRNKIAHRGELCYRDDKGTIVSVDCKNVEAWWNAVAHVMTWLGTLK
jgi:hypothetical protein